MKSKNALQVGNEVFVRTVTLYYTGRVAELIRDQNGRLEAFVLEDAAWIPQTARWSITLTTGELNDVEPFVDPVTVNRDVFVDATLWRFALPRKAK